MRRVVTLAAAFGLAALAGCAAPPEDFREVEGSVRIEAGPYLQMPARDVLVVCWRTDRPAPGEVRLARVGLKMGWQQIVRSKALGREPLQKVKLSTLEAGAAYEYVVAAGDTVGAAHRLRTPDPEEKSARFVVYGSSYASGASHEAIARAALKEGPDFAVHTGGLTSEGRGEEQYVEQLFKPAKELLARCPLFVAPAEVDAGSNDYYRLFSLPGNERWYSFEIGPVHATVLDSQSDLGPSSEQMQWAAEDLAKASRPWKLVFVHGAPFPAGADKGDGKVRGLAAFFEQMQVAAVFSGGGGYFRTAPLGEDGRGVVYVVTGAGAAAGASPALPEWGAVFRGGCHFCLVEATPERLAVRVIGEGGEDIDGLRLERGATGPVFSRKKAAAEVEGRKQAASPSAP